jgi:hypothetical protein
MPRLNVNGRVRDFEAEPDTLLRWALRRQLGLTGTTCGCGIRRHAGRQPERRLQLRRRAVAAALLPALAWAMLPATAAALGVCAAAIEARAGAGRRAARRIASALRAGPDLERNPAWLWLKDVEARFVRDSARCRDAVAMRGVAARHPAFDERRGKPVTPELFLLQSAAGMPLETPAVRP